MAADMWCSACSFQHTSGFMQQKQLELSLTAAAAGMCPIYKNEQEWLGAAVGGQHLLFVGVVPLAVLFASGSMCHAWLQCCVMHTPHDAECGLHQLMCVWGSEVCTALQDTRYVA